MAFTSSSNTTPGDEIVAGKTTLKGHQASVLCLDLSSSSSCDDDLTSSLSTSSTSSQRLLLLSGSEDHTARLWDLRDHTSKTRACLCIQTSGDVLSAMFAPNVVGTSSSVATTLSEQKSQKHPSPFSLDYTIYLAVENAVLEYDLRHTQAPIIRQQQAATRNLGPILQHQDEVNQISMAFGCLQRQQQQQQHNKKNTKKSPGCKKKSDKSHDMPAPIRSNHSSLYLAACDDAGTVRFMDASSSTISTTILHHDPKGVAVVPTCSFRPRNDHCSSSKRNGRSTLELASGGSDCQIHLWDLSRPKKPISSFTFESPSAIQSDGRTSSSSKPQVCNPPLVHSLAWSYSGQSLAAGLGNGSIGIFAVIENRRLVQTGLLQEGAHDSSVVSVVYPNFSTNSAERVICSAGSDGSILFWDVGSMSTTFGWEDEEWDEQGNDGSQKDSRGEQKAVADVFAKSLGINKQQNDNGSLGGKPQKLFEIPHRQKLNWVTRASTTSSSIFVADTSTSITCYTIPMG